MNKDVLAAKQNVVNEIVSKVKECETVVVVEYRGLTVAQLEEIRRALAKEDSELAVYKNSLVERACDELGYAELKNIMTGPNAVIFSKEVSGGAKVAAKYAKRFKDVFVVKGGAVEGKFVDANGVINDVAKMPNKEGLLSMFLSCLQAPVRQFACAVKAVADSKQ